MSYLHQKTSSLNDDSELKGLEVLLRVVKEFGSGKPGHEREARANAHRAEKRTVRIRTLQFRCPNCSTLAFPNSTLRSKPTIWNRRRATDVRVNPLDWSRMLTFVSH